MGALWNTVKAAGANIRAVGFSGGEYLAAAAKGAAIGAGLGGVTEWAGGGSFWSGAKSGALTGAMVGGGYRAAKVGALGKDAIGGSISDMSTGYAHAYKAIKEEPNVSKQVGDLIREKQGVNLAKHIFGHAGV